MLVQSKFLVKLVSWAHFDWFLSVDVLLVQVDLQPLGTFS